MFNIKQFTKFSLIIISLFSITSCQSFTGLMKPEPQGQPAYGAMTGYSKSTTTKELMIQGATPLKQEQVPGYSAAIKSDIITSLDSTPFVINTIGTDVVLIIQKDILLTSDFSINQGESKVLDKLAKILKKYDKTLVEITGHTDNIGQPDTNQKISVIRAEAISKYLMSDGVNGSRLFINGMGETRWIADNNTPEGRATNNRIEIRISPMIYY